MPYILPKFAFKARSQFISYFFSTSFDFAAVSPIFKWLLQNYRTSSPFLYVEKIWFRL